MSARRVYGHTTCLGCCRRVEVIWPYSNSDSAIGIEDHGEMQGAEYVRCPDGGLRIWSQEHGWTEHRFRARYGEADIERIES